MVSRVETIRIGDVDVLVETIAVAGTEPTSAVDRVQDRMADSFERAKATIVAMGQSMVDVIDRLASSAAAHPDKVEVEFGLGFSAKGNVIVAEAKADATLKVKLVYEVSTTT